jgi:hypothetical protein
MAMEPKLLWKVSFGKFQFIKTIEISHLLSCIRQEHIKLEKQRPSWMLLPAEPFEGPLSKICSRKKFDNWRISWKRMEKLWPRKHQGRSIP